MKLPTWIVFAIALAFGNAQAEPSDTTFWLLQRVTVATSSSITGILPGTKVTLVKDNGTTLTVSDGVHTFEVSRAQVTTDVTLARKTAADNYTARIAADNSRKKEEAEIQKSQAKTKREKALRANAQRIIGHVLYQQDGGLIVQCDESPPPTHSSHVVSDSMASIGGGGRVYAGGSGAPTRQPAQSEVQGTIWLTGYPNQRETADGDAIDVDGYEAGVHQDRDGGRTRQYKFVSN
jgi:hypothetical protein